MFVEMNNLTIWTLDSVPPVVSGFVRDLRLRWACEEADISYTVRTVAFEGRETNHLEHQPFGQVPFLTDGELEIFESGACLLPMWPACRDPWRITKQPNGSTGKSSPANRLRA